MKKLSRSIVVVVADLALSLGLTKLWYVYPHSFPSLLNKPLDNFIVSLAKTQDEAADIELLLLIFIAFVFVSIITWVGIRILNVIQKSEASACRNAKACMARPCRPTST